MKLFFYTRKNIGMESRGMHHYLQTVVAISEMCLFFKDESHRVEDQCFLGPSDAFLPWKY